MEGMMFYKSILIKIRNIILPLLIIYAPVLAHASNWNSGGSSSQVENQTLICEFQKYETSGYKLSVAKDWIRENQTHIFNGMGASYPDRNDWGTARITTNNNNKLAWEYRVLSTDNKGAQSESRFKYIFFKTNNKVAASVDFVGYRGINNVWGTCKVEVSAVTNINETAALPVTIPTKFNQFRKVTFKLVSGDIKTMGVGKVEKNNKGFSTDGRVILNGNLCVTSANFDTGSKEGSFKINCPDGYSVKGGYMPLGTNNGSVGRGYDADGNPVEYRVHSNSGSNFVSKSDFIKFHNDRVKVAPPTSKLDKAKSTCTELGFTTGTEKHGECVLKLMDK